MGKGSPKRRRVVGWGARDSTQMKQIGQMNTDLLFMLQHAMKGKTYIIYMIIP
ncbi:hypothetical protein OAT16_06425 [Prolixibacteraceae bacterium]|nr:hypothetical protein [Prolixibacteraceae bacterium]